ncbi:MAG: hypothetical protein JXB42_00285, partial [Deltaproteobacteria bacterium]|nr:hypothetical protein [Deltaproteobacteria bacterium]
PQGYMQTFTLFSWEMIEKAGVISMPGGDGKMALVDVRDVAKVAVKALTEPGHAGKIYDVTGLVALGFADQAAILTKTLGKRVTYMPCSEWQLKCIMSVLGVPETPAEHVVGVFRMQRENRLEKVHPTLKDLGIPYTPYEQFAADLVAGRTGGGNSFQPPDSLFVKALNASFIVTMRVRHQLHSVFSLLR